MRRRLLDVDGVVFFCCSSVVAFNFCCFFFNMCSTYLRLKDLTAISFDFGTWTAMLIFWVAMPLNGCVLDSVLVGACVVVCWLGIGLLSACGAVGIGVLLVCAVAVRSVGAYSRCAGFCGNGTRSVSSVLQLRITF